MSVAPITKRTRVPFFLDDALGPNQAHIALVMCDFLIAFSGTFAVDLAGEAFDIPALLLTGTPFEMAFPADYTVTIGSLRVLRADSGKTMRGTLQPGQTPGQFRAQIDLPLRIEMTVGLPDSDYRPAAFETTLHLTGTLSESAFRLTGSFDFQLEGYGDADMVLKFGSCAIALSATSRLACRLQSAQLTLALADQSSDLTVQGAFWLGLDGVAVRVLGLNLTASPFTLGPTLTLDDIHVTPAGRQPPDVQFSGADDGTYAVAARIPARLTGQMRLLGGEPQPFTAGLTLVLAGTVALGGTVTLALQDHIDVQIGGGTVALGVTAQMTASVKLADRRVVPLGGRRAHYADLRDAADPAPLIAALDDPDATARQIAVTQLGRFPNERYARLRGLNDPAPDVRIAALRAYGAETPTMVLVTHMDPLRPPREWLAALHAVAEQPGDSWTIACTLAVRHPDPVVRCKALEITGRRGTPGEINWLRSALDADDPFVQLSAAAALLANDDLSHLHAGAGRTAADLIAHEDDMCILMIGSLALAESREMAYRRVLTRLIARTDDPFVQSAARYAIRRLSETGKIQ